MISERRDYRDEDERVDWEEEQKRLDRQWYGMDEGYDENQNPFTGHEDYIKKKEAELELKKKKRISAQQRQINRVRTMGEVGE